MVTNCDRSCKCKYDANGNDHSLHVHKPYTSCNQHVTLDLTYILSLAYPSHQSQHYSACSKTPSPQCYLALKQRKQLLPLLQWSNLQPKHGHTCDTECYLFLSSPLGEILHLASTRPCHDDVIILNAILGHMT